MNLWSMCPIYLCHLAAIEKIVNIWNFEVFVLLVTIICCYSWHFFNVFFFLICELLLLFVAYDAKDEMFAPRSFIVADVFHDCRQILLNHPFSSNSSFILGWWQRMDGHKGSMVGMIFWFILLCSLMIKIESV